MKGQEVVCRYNRMYGQTILIFIVHSAVHLPNTQMLLTFYDMYNVIE